MKLHEMKNHIYLTPFVKKQKSTSITSFTALRLTLQQKKKKTLQEATSFYTSIPPQWDM